jgi:predicted signal transduction protein with EAL and GGDEF domain
MKTKPAILATLIILGMVAAFYVLTICPVFVVKWIFFTLLGAVMIALWRQLYDLFK